MAFFFLGGLRLRLRLLELELFDREPDRELEPDLEPDLEEDVSRAADLGAGFDAGGRMPNPVSSSSKKGLDMATSGGREAPQGRE